MDEYIRVLLEQVRCKKAHELIENEIRGHIEEQTETNILNGMDNKSALKEAIKDMGSPVEAGISLDRIHRPQMSKSVIILMAIICVITLIIHFFLGNEITGDTGFTKYTIAGFIIMIAIYKLDYSFLAKYSRIIALGFLIITIAIILIQNEFESFHYNPFIYFLQGHVSLFALMMLYVPIFSAVIYRYYGQGMLGIVKSIIWMICPVIIAIIIPSLTLAVILFYSMAIVLTLAVYKKWFNIPIKKFLIIFWSCITFIPVFIISCNFNFISEYNRERIFAMFSDDATMNYKSNIVNSYLFNSQFIGGQDYSLTDLYDEFRSDYIFTYLASSYGLVVSIAVCVLLIILLFMMFKISFNQKNQSGMMIGFGCSTIFLMIAAINVLENLGILPFTQTFLPFFSTGGSCIIVSYILLGLLLSVNRYKNIHPIHFKIKPKAKEDLCE